MKTSAGMLKHLLAGSLFLVLFACKKGMVNDQADALPAAGKQRTAKTLGATPDVYVAGAFNGGAAYWKNTVRTDLAGGIQATGIAVVGTDVYVCGYGQNPNTGLYKALYWKNGQATPTELTDGTTSDGTATGIGVKSNGDVYIAGYTGRYVQTPVYWLNGTQGALVNANGTPTSGGIPGEVFISANDDVYMANINDIIPTYWKNGTLVTSLQKPFTTTQPYSHVEDVKEVNGVVYAVGAYINGPGYKPLYWENNTLNGITLGAPDAVSYPKNIAVSAGGQRFVAGVGGANVSVEQILTWDNVGAADYWGFNTVTAYPRAVWDGTDIYVCGSDRAASGHSQARVYMNGFGNYTPLNNASTDDANAVDIKVTH